MRYVKSLLFSLILLMLQGCASHFFQADDTLYSTPTAYGLNYDEVVFYSRDGTELYAWHIYPQKPSKGLLFIAHGNAQNISAHFVSWVWLINAGYEVFIFDYRAYGKSEGKSSIKGSVEDTRAALDYLESQYKGQYFVCGQSLGGTMLLNALNKRDNTHIKAAIIDSTFVGFSDIASDKMAQVWITWPFQWIPYLSITGDYDAKNKLKINLPVLFLHGSKDRVISPNSSWQLYDLSDKPREFWLVKDAEHISSFNNKVIQKDFLDFLDKGKIFYTPYHSNMKIYD